MSLQIFSVVDTESRLRRQSVSSEQNLQDFRRHSEWKICNNRLKSSEDGKDFLHNNCEMFHCLPEFCFGIGTQMIVDIIPSQQLLWTFNLMYFALNVSHQYLMSRVHQENFSKL